jgi:hypothetical protein
MVKQFRFIQLLDLPMVLLAKCLPALCVERGLKLSIVQFTQPRAWQPRGGVDR